MVTAEFHYLCRLLRDRSGLVLTPDKQYLVENRLLPVARRSGLDSVSDLVRSLTGPHGEQRIVDVVEAMTTSETMFFRDRAPFAYFREVMLPALMNACASRRRLRIWCAAASTGQEAYSIAMCMKERGGDLAGWQIEILATDLSGAVVEYAEAGTYNQFEVQRGLPVRSLLQHFSKVDDGWQISSDIRSMIRFEQLNLLDDFSDMEMFDVIFCRNVLCYFDPATRVDVLKRLSRVTKRHGYLVLGAGETAAGLAGSFMPLRHCDGLFAPGPAIHLVRPATPRLAVVG